MIKHLNSYAERFVLSIKSECLSKIIPLGVSHLYRIINEYTTHYHLERPHQGLDNELIERSGTGGIANGTIKRKERLGGLLNYYYRDAA